MGMLEIGPRDALNRIYNKPVNKEIKYCSIVAISITLVLLLVCLVWGNQLSDICLLYIKGFAGLFAIIFAVLYGVLIYRVYREYISGKE